MLTAGISPCPNDTFIFAGLATGQVLAPAPLRFVLEDIDTLNQQARQNRFDVVKVSFAVIPALLDEYVVLRTGAALGHGCGPLLVTKAGRIADERALASQTVAVPGLDTTALLLLRLAMPTVQRFEVMPFFAIPDAVASGRSAAGLLIHETRFTYAERDLVCVEDLGAWWERTTGLPIPLGAIVARRSLGEEMLGRIEAAIGQSLAFAHARREVVWPYVMAHSQERDEGVVASHIELYVNEFSAALGETGQAAIARLFEAAARTGRPFPEAARPYLRSPYP